MFNMTQHKQEFYFLVKPQQVSLQGHSTAALSDLVHAYNIGVDDLAFAESDLEPDSSARAWRYQHDQSHLFELSEQGSVEMDKLSAFLSIPNVKILCEHMTFQFGANSYEIRLGLFSKNEAHN